MDYESMCIYGYMNIYISLYMYSRITVFAYMYGGMQIENKQIMNSNSSSENNIGTRK